MTVRIYQLQLTKVEKGTWFSGIEYETTASPCSIPTGTVRELRVHVGRSQAQRAHGRDSHSVASCVLTIIEDVGFACFRCRAGCCSSVDGHYLLSRHAKESVIEALWGDTVRFRLSRYARQQYVSNNPSFSVVRVGQDNVCKQMLS